MAVAEVADDLLRANLTAFGRYMPELFQALSNYQPQTTLIENSDGSRDVDFRGQKLYDVNGDGTTGPELARRQVETMRGTPRRRLLIHPLDSKSLDSNGSRFVESILKRGVDDGVSFLEYPTDDGAYHLILFGMGLGYHLTELIELCEPFSICIVEPNLDFLYHSLATFDWAPLLERRATWASSVSILTADNAEEIARQIRIHCRHANPSATDAALLASSYANDTMDMAIKLFQRDAHLVHTGLGFFYDEMEMTRASYNNLVRHDDFHVFRRHDWRPGLPAFVIGSGPSIDDDLEFIKQHQDRAVLICCGSALGVLLANGIKPDFQIILENSEHPYDMLVSIAKSYSFDGIHFFGSNTVSPKIRELFPERTYFMRQSLSSYAMFSPGFEYSLERSGPTVTNTGLEMALHSGFNEIYLFGCDLGARSPERHHSRFSPYQMAERTAGYDAAVVFAQSLPSRQLGNFGGIAFTNDILTWSRDAMEESLGHMGGGRRIFNCSDGIRIKGARALVSASAKITAPDGRKAEVLRNMIGHWPEASTFKFGERWRSVDWRDRVHRFAERIIEICREKPERSQQFLHQMCPILIPDHDRLPTFEEYFLRGTAFVSIISADYYMRRVHPPEKRAEFRSEAYDELIRVIRTMLDQTDWFFDHLDDLESNFAMKEGLRAWMEAPTPTA